MLVVRIRMNETLAKMGAILNNIFPVAYNYSGNVTFINLNNGATSIGYVSGDALYCGEELTIACDYVITASYLAADYV